MFYWIGLVAAIYGIATVVRQLFLIFEMAYFPAPFDLERYGEWVMITGCTDGIGKQYAVQLAAAGARKFILIGRNEQKLKDTIEAIEFFGRTAGDGAKFEFETRLIDFATFDSYHTMADLIDSKEIGVFINSVGVSFPLPQHLHEVETKYPGLLWQHINVNLKSATQLTSLLLPQMIKRKAGLIIYLSSGSSTQPTPMQSSYAGGKKLLDKLALDLQLEYPQLTFQSIKPYYVATKMTQNKLNWTHATIMIPSAVEYVRQAIGTIGRHVSTHAYAPHVVQSWVLRLLPESLLGPNVLKVMYKQRAGEF